MLTKALAPNVMYELTRNILFGRDTLGLVRRNVRSTILLTSQEPRMTEHLFEVEEIS